MNLFDNNGCPCDNILSRGGTRDAREKGKAMKVMETVFWVLVFVVAKVFRQIPSEVTFEQTEPGKRLAKKWFAE